MQVDELPQVGHVLRGFVGYAGHVILENQEGCGLLSVGLHLLNIDDRPVRDAADAVQPGPPLPLNRIRTSGFASQQEISRQQSTRTAQDDCVETNWNHDVWKEPPQTAAQYLNSIRLAGESWKRGGWVASQFKLCGLSPRSLRFRILTSSTGPES